jgi:hypothetical protein
MHQDAFLIPPSPIASTGAGKINSVEQPLAEIRSENAHISPAREACRVMSHHLMVEAPN